MSNMVLRKRKTAANVKENKQQEPSKQLKKRKRNQIEEIKSGYFILQRKGVEEYAGLFTIDIGNIIAEL